jgi:tetratricopeptide (TPR) repeat protein
MFFMARLPVKKARQRVPPTFTTSNLLERVQEYLSACEYELAYKFALKVLDQAPHHVEALEICATCCIEMQLYDQAVGYLDQAIAVQPDAGYNKYMLYGQLSGGMDAIVMFTKGVELMMTEWQSMDDKRVLARQIGTALIAMTEIYLTDCW